MSMGQEQTFRFLLTEKVCFFFLLYFSTSAALYEMHRPSDHPSESAAGRDGRLFFLGATFILGLIPLVRHIAVRSRLDGVEI